MNVLEDATHVYRQGEAHSKKLMVDSVELVLSGDAHGAFIAAIAHIIAANTFFAFYRQVLGSHEGDTTMLEFCELARRIAKVRRPEIDATVHAVQAVLMASMKPPSPKAPSS